MKGTIDKFLRNIENNVMVNVDFNATYLGADSLLYCNRCNTPIQCRIEVFGKERIVPCLCKCEGERLERERLELERRENMRKIEELRIKGFQDDNIVGWRFENTNGSNAKVMQVMKNYVDNFAKFREQGKGLLLYGNVGTGKTFAAACVANALIDNGVPCYVTNFNTASNMIFENRQSYLDNLQRFRLLVLDDLGTERKTEYMQEIVFSIVDARYSAGLPMIVTTNLTLEEIKNPNSVAEARCYDRILERCFPVEVAGVNQRRKKIVDDYAETKALLGI